MSTMQKMTPELIAKACNGKLFCAVEDRQLEITGAVIDSRKVEYHNLFFAVRGEKTDGHNYINQVYEKGALLVVCEEAPEEKEALRKKSWKSTIFLVNDKIRPGRLQ